MLQSIRRSGRPVSSTATRVYQILEWVLILFISLQRLERGASEGFGRSWLSSFRWRDLASDYGSTYRWQSCLILVTTTVVLTYESRATWMSFLLYVVIFPQLVGRQKCGQNQQNSTICQINVQISVVSYLHCFLPYFRPFGTWTAHPDYMLQFLGHVLSPDQPYISTLHVHILQLFSVLAGSSLSATEIALISHALTAFTAYYQASSATSQEMPMNEIFFFAFIYGLMIAVWLAKPFLTKNIRLAKIKPQLRPKNVMKQRITCAVYTYCIIALFVLTVVRWYLVHKLQQDPFVYLLFFLIEDTVKPVLICYWIFVAGSGVVVVIYFWGSKPIGGFSGFGKSARRLLRHSTENDLHKATAAEDVFFEEEDTLARRARALDRRRKFFHGLVVVLFLPTLNRNPQLSYLALSFAITAFIFEEVLRITVLPPLGVPIHKFLSGFTDHRDASGHVVVSHLFLLLGVATPVWLTLTGVSPDDIGLVRKQGSMAMLSGVLTLGVGDAAASIVGKKFGRHKWPQLKKSIEGTIAFVFAMLAGGIVMLAISPTDTSVDWTRFVIGVLATGILEAVSTQNDNLIIPVYMWCLVY